jgi:hypothetical protein
MNMLMSKCPVGNPWDLGRSRSSSIFYYSFIVWLIYMSVPWQYTLQLRVGGITVLHFVNGCLGFAGLLCAATVLKSFDWRFWPVFFFVGYVALISPFTYYLNAAPKFFELLSLDLLPVVGLFVGLSIGRDFVLLRDIARFTIVFGSVALVVLDMLLLGRIIESTAGMERNLDPAGFTLVFFLCSMKPLYSVCFGHERSHKVYVLLCYVSVATFGVISQTRSCIIMLLLTILFELIFRFKGAKRVLFIGVVCAAVVGSVVFSPNAASTFGRFEQLGRLREEDRSIELEVFYDKYVADGLWFTGLGLGSGVELFPEVGGVSSGPHIGILTFVFKAGVVGCFFLVWMGCCIVIPMIVTRDVRRKSIGWIGCFYLVSSSISGGWSLMGGLLVVASIVGLRAALPPSNASQIGGILQARERGRLSLVTKSV